MMRYLVDEHRVDVGFRDHEVLKFCTFYAWQDDLKYLAEQVFKQSRWRAKGPNAVEQTAIDSDPENERLSARRFVQDKEGAIAGGGRLSRTKR
jgi:hypothetical protein